MNEDANPYVGHSSSGALQVRKRRRDGWTRRDEDAFFKFYRINCNVSASACAIGKSPNSAFRLLRRSPAFALRRQETLEEARQKLHGNLIVYSQTGGKPIEIDAQGDPIEPDLADMDPQLALQVLRLAEKSAAAMARRRAKAPVSDAELTAELLRRFDVLERRRARERAGG